MNYTENENVALPLGKKKNAQADAEVMSLLIGIHDDLKQFLSEMRQRQERDVALQAKFRECKEVLDENSRTGD